MSVSCLLPIVTFSFNVSFVTVNPELIVSVNLKVYLSNPVMFGTIDSTLNRIVSPTCAEVQLFPSIVLSTPGSFPFKYTSWLAFETVVNIGVNASLLGIIT